MPADARVGGGAMAQERSVILHGQEIPSLCLVGEFELLLVELNAGQADTRGGVFRGVAGTALQLPCARPPIFGPVLERPDVLRMTPRWRSSRRSCTHKPRSPSPTLLGSVPTRRCSQSCVRQDAVHPRHRRRRKPAHALTRADLQDNASMQTNTGRTAPSERRKPMNAIVQGTYEKRMFSNSGTSTSPCRTRTAPPVSRPLRDAHDEGLHRWKAR
jgi:hypothetical protein